MKRPLLTAATATLCAIVAACSPTGQQGVDLAALEQVGRAAFRQETAIDPGDLADRLVKRSGDFALVDLRAAEDFAAGHIDSASRQDLPELIAAVDSGTALVPGKDVILYGSDGAAGAQAAALLRLAGRTNTYYLVGGYAGWQAHLRPEAAAAGSDPASAQAAAKQAAVACYFAGDYVAAAGLVPRGGSASGYTPEVKPAAPPADALGLGLGLGLGPEAAEPPPAPAPAAADALGLGLGLGLGPETAPAPPAARGRLNIGEGC